VDVAIEASGSEFGKSFVHKAELALGLETDTAEMINECLESVRKFGRVSVIADYVGYANHVNLGNMMERGIALIGCGQCPVQRYWKDILGMLERGEVDPGIMLTHRVSIDDLAKAYTAQEQRKEGWVKCFVETRFSRPKAEGTPALTSL
jgi:threonine dehydrogenase-like Zn-dependent dehydrogenase